MDWRNYVDVSSCLLFEATGDSEADTGHFSHVDDHMGASSEDKSLAEDDAFSCSCENEYSDDFDDYRIEDEENVYVQEDDDGNEEEEEKSVDDEDEDAVDQIRKDGIKVLKRNTLQGPGGVEVQGQLKKLKVCGAEIVNERDKDMHFWETCLAS